MTAYESSHRKSSDNLPSATSMTGGEAVVKSLEAANVSVVFGIPGSHNLAIYDALAKSENIRHVLARHEQGAGFMADGYARASGNTGVCLTTTGPAALNTISPLGTAYNDSLPVLLVASQNPTKYIGQDKGLIHEIANQLDCFEPITVWRGRASSVDSIPKTIKDAFTHMRNGRHRPAVIEMPTDLLAEVDTVRIPNSLTSPSEKHAIKDLGTATDLLASAKRPAIWAGGGVISSEASLDLIKLAELIQAPVFTTVLGKGVIPGDHPLSAGSAILHPTAREFLIGSDAVHRSSNQGSEDLKGCDLLLAIGTRFTDEETDSWTLQLPKTLIHVDVDPEEFGRNYLPTLAVEGDAKEVIRELTSRLNKRTLRGDNNRITEIKYLREAIRNDCLKRAPEGVNLIDCLQAALPREAILVSDLTVAAYWCRRLLEVYGPRNNLYPWGFGTLGYALPAAIGAKAARPDAPVVALVGDGGFLFNCQELTTAIQHDLPIIILVFNDNAYGVLKPQQQALFGRTIGVDLLNPNFLKLAESFGINAQRVDTLPQLEPAITSAIKSNQTSLIEVTMPVPWPVMEPSTRLFDQSKGD